MERLQGSLSVLESSGTSAPEGCPGTYGYWNGAQAHVGTGEIARAKIDTVKSTR